MSKFFSLLLTLTIIVSGEILSLHDAQVELFKRNIDLQKAAIEIQKAQAELSETRSALFPSIDLSASAIYLSEKSSIKLPIPPGKELETGRNDKIETGIDCTYPIFTGFSRSNMIKSKSSLIESKEASLHSVRNRISFLLAIAYCQWYFANKHQETLQEHIKNLNDHLTLTKQQHDYGATIYARVLEAESRIENAKIDLLDVSETADSLKREILGLIRLPDTPMIPQDSFISIDTLSPAPNLLQSRAEITYIDALKQQFEKTKKVYQSNQFPTVAAIAGYRFGRPGLDMGSDDFMGYFTAGLQLKWNLFNGFKTNAQISNIKSSIELLQNDRTRLIESWNRSLNNLKQHLEKIDQKIKAVQLSISSAKELVTSSKEQFESGQAAQSDYLNALDNYSRMQLRYEQTILERRITIIQAQYESGYDLLF